MLSMRRKDWHQLLPSDVPRSENPVPEAAAVPTPSVVSPAPAPKDPPAPASSSSPASALEAAAPEAAVLSATSAPHYLKAPVLSLVWHRFPWLVSLMLIQSISGWVVERFEKLIARHVILAAFLTMLVGGGGNSSGQTVASLVRALGAGEIDSTDLRRVLAREAAIGAMLAVGLGIAAYPRVLLLSSHSTTLDAVTISLSYAIIVFMANVIGVLVVMTLNQWGSAAVGSPPVVQVLVDVLGIVITMFVAQALLGDEE